MSWKSSLLTVIQRLNSGTEGEVVITFHIWPDTETVVVV